VRTKSINTTRRLKDNSHSMVSLCKGSQEILLRKLLHTTPASKQLSATLLSMLSSMTMLHMFKSE
jgi:hypothetical protein